MRNIHRSEILGSIFFFSALSVFGVTMTGDSELMPRIEGMRNTFLLLTMSVISFKKWVFSDQNFYQFFPVVQQELSHSSIENVDEQGNYTGHLP